MYAFRKGQWTLSMHALNNDHTCFEWIEDKFER